LKTETETRFNCETKISLVCSTSYLRTRAVSQIVHNNSQQL